MYKLVIPAAIIILTIGISNYCNGPKCYPGSFKNITHYSVKTALTTPGGIPIDVRGVTEDINYTKLDSIILETKQCLEDLGYPEISLSCLKIKVAANWYLAHDGITQVFPCDIDQSVCDKKVKSGQLPDLNKKCACRATIQNNDIIIIPPNLGLLRSELVRLFTGINYIWTPELRKCVQHSIPE